MDSAPERSNLESRLRREVRSIVVVELNSGGTVSNWVLGTAVVVVVVVVGVGCDNGVSNRLLWVDASKGGNDWAKKGYSKGAPTNNSLETVYRSSVGCSQVKEPLSWLLLWYCKVDTQTCLIVG